MASIAKCVQTSRISPAFAPLPQIVCPGAYHSFAELLSTVENAAAHQKPAPLTSYRPLGYFQKLRYLFPTNQQIVFPHNLCLLQVYSPVHHHKDTKKSFSIQEALGRWDRLPTLT